MNDRHYYQSLTKSMVSWVVAVSLTPLLVCAAVLGYEFHTAYRAQVQATWQAALARAQAGDGRVDSLEYRVACRDGRVLYMLIGGQLIGNARKK